MAKVTLSVEGCMLSISGLAPKIAQVRDEPYDCVKDPVRVIEALKTHRPRVDIFSFMQGISDTVPHHPYLMEPASLAVLPITTFENWWKNQISDKTRNLVRKAAKSGVEVRVAQLDDEFIRGVKSIYDESSVRQGRDFAHFQKPIEVIASEVSTFPGRSTFLGAYLQARMIGFAKLVESDGAASLMHIISMISERNKAPTNALLSKAVEVCAHRGIPKLHYGVWSIGGLGLFKENHAFQSVPVPRYFVPITAKGGLALKVGLHRPLNERLPESWRERLIAIRNRWRPARPVPGRA